MTETQTVRLNFKPREWQRRCFRERKRFNVVVAHRRSGKTKLGVMQLLDSALQDTREAPLYVFCAPFLKQARAIAWRELKVTVAPLGPLVVDISESDLTITFRHNGARVMLAGADNADALRGLRVDGLVVDEVGFVKPDTWTDILQPSLADRGGWTLFIGTPCGINLFSELFFAAEGKADWFAARFACHDTDALPADEIKRLQRDMPAQAFARELLCDFSASGDDQLISLMDATEATRRRYVQRDIELAPRVLGVDPARFGDDRSVIVRRQGLQMFDAIVLKGIDNMQLASRVANVIEEWRPDACFIDSGAGAGIIDRLRQLQYDVTEVPFGGKASKPDLFVNRRTEMWCLLGEWLKVGAIPNDAALKQELSTPTYSFDSVGRRVLESKDQIRKRISAGSPDIADALALTFAMPVYRRDPASEQLARIRNRTQRPYDIYKE